MNKQVPQSTNLFTEYANNVQKNRAKWIISKKYNEDRHAPLTPTKNLSFNTPRKA
jgi:hypothetical protein